MPRKGRKSEDFMRRHEKLLEKVAYASLWNLAFVVLINSVQLIVMKKADMLFPLKTLTALGFAFWLASSGYSVYIHYIEHKLSSPILFCAKAISGVASIGTMIYALPPTMALSAELSYDIPLSPPIILALIAGIFSAIAGLVLSIRRTNL